MEQLQEIVLAGEPILKEKALPVQEIDGKVKETLDLLVKTMYDYKLTGLTAPQIGIPWRIMVLDIGDGNLFEMINPVLGNFGIPVRTTERCPSVPRFEGTLFRAETLTCEFYDRQGRWLRLEARGMLAVAIQHEYDHLDGMLFTDKAVDIMKLPLPEPVAGTKIKI